MTICSHPNADKKRVHRIRRLCRRLLALAVCFGFAAAAGCQTDFASKLNLRKSLFKPKDIPQGPTDSLVLQDGELREDESAAPGTVAAKLEGGMKLFHEGKYREAERIFHSIGTNTENPSSIAEKARYYEGECQRMRGDYRSASKTYEMLFKDFRNGGRYHKEANHRLFDIANYWLDGTREKMKAHNEKRENKRWFVMPASYISLSREKPLYDTQGHAMRLMERVYINDMRGPLAEKALFYLGTVHFFNANYTEADFYYNQLYNQFPNSDMASKALKQSIICKQMIPGGSVYDSRIVHEARGLIQQAAAYPDLQGKNENFLQEQLVSISSQLADRDFRVAQFYERVGKPASAYFYYELVRRRYPGSEYAEKSVGRMRELRQYLQENPPEESNKGVGTVLDYVMPWRRPRAVAPDGSQPPAPEQTSSPGPIRRLFIPSTAPAPTAQPSPQPTPASPNTQPRPFTGAGTQPGQSPAVLTPPN